MADLQINAWWVFTIDGRLGTGFCPGESVLRSYLQAGPKNPLVCSGLADVLSCVGNVPGREAFSS